MRLRKALEILLLTAIGVGICSGFGGAYLWGSVMLEPYADLMDGFAEYYYELGAYDEAREARNEATGIRDRARELHDYGIYFGVGALLILIAGAGWMAWRFGKEKPKEI